MVRMAAPQRLVSGIQPSGTLHIGNYFGAMQRFVSLQDRYDAYISIVNYHALTTMRDPAQLQDQTLAAAIDHLAIGLDPEKVTLFVQSDVPELHELTWIFNTLVTVPYLSRAHAYKEKTEQGIEASVGLFDYPVLMAADILLFGADVVPVGQDQKQHIEMARDIAEKFNQAYTEMFTLPEPLIDASVATVPGTDGRKMSKSYGNTIPLFAERDEIETAVMGIVTDSSGTRPENVYAIHALFRDEHELASLYAEHQGNYKVLKEMLIEDIDAVIAPLRKRRAELAADPDAVRRILHSGRERAQEIAHERMSTIREIVGLTLQ